MSDSGKVVVIHPLVVRVCHWPNVVAILVMVLSGWRFITRRPFFPSPSRRRSLSVAGVAAPSCGISPLCGCWWLTASFRVFLTKTATG